MAIFTKNKPVLMLTAVFAVIGALGVTMPINNQAAASAGSVSEDVFIVRELGAESVTLSDIPIPHQDCNENYRYKVRVAKYMNANDVYQYWRFNSGDNPANDLTIEGLDTEGYYDFAVKAKCDADNGGGTLKTTKTYGPIATSEVVRGYWPF